MIYRLSARAVLVGLVIFALLFGCGGGKSGPARVALTEANLQQIEVIGEDITAKVNAATETKPPDEVYAEVARQVEGSPGISSATADETSLTVRYDCGAVEQWITPVQPEEPVDFQQVSRSIEAAISRNRLTTPIAKSIWINPFHDQHWRVLSVCCGNDALIRLPTFPPVRVPAAACEAAGIDTCTRLPTECNPSFPQHT